MLQYAIGAKETARCLLSRLHAAFLQSFIAFGRVSAEILVLWSDRWRCALFERKSKYSGISNLMTPACKHCSVLVEHVCDMLHLTFGKTQSRLMRVLYSKKMQRNNEMSVAVVWHVTLGAGLVVRKHFEGPYLSPSCSRFEP